jgi:hypothetical protein
MAVHGNTSTTLFFSDTALVKRVLCAAEAAKTLSQWASLSKQLCLVARSSSPFGLRIRSPQQARLVIRSLAQGRDPFSGCTDLYVDAYDLAMCCLAGGVLDIAQQWTALKSLGLVIGDLDQQQQQQQQTSQQKWRQLEWQQQGEQEEEGAALEYPTSSLLLHVRTLQQLRHLELCAPYLGTCSVQLLLQLTQLTSLQLSGSATPAGAPPAAADLGALSGMTRLVQLCLSCDLAPHLPASPEGPYCYPTSLQTLVLDSTNHRNPTSMAHWVAHLPGCTQLQSLTLEYGGQQHASAHPSHVARLLARHGQLHTWTVFAHGVPDWGATVAGWVGVEEVPAGGEWRPGASWAALGGLRCLRAPFLHVRDQADWQHLAHLTALTSLSGVTFHYAPPLEAGMPLPLLEELDYAYTSLDGHGVGRLLLACPMLEDVLLSMVDNSPPPAPIPAIAPTLPSHPTLKHLDLQECCQWGDAAAAVAQFAALAPVRGGVPHLELTSWPAPSARGSPALPDLSPCTALIDLNWDCPVWGYPNGGQAPSANSPLAPRQEDFLSMVRPLQQLEALYVCATPEVNPQVALVLQYMLPRLQLISLCYCGRLTPRPAAAAGGLGHQGGQQGGPEVVAEQEREALLKVKRLLRPGLSLYAQVA